MKYRVEKGTKALISDTLDFTSNYEVVQTQTFEFPLTLSYYHETPERYRGSMKYLYERIAEFHPKFDFNSETDADAFWNKVKHYYNSGYYVFYDEKNRRPHFLIVNVDCVKVLEYNE